MDRLERICLGFLALIFAAVAVIGLVVPHVLFDPIGVPLDDIAGLAEIRAAYAGLFGTASWLLVTGLLRESRRTLALTVAFFVLGGFTVGRLLSWGVDGTPENPVALANLVAEAVGTLIAGLLLFARRGRAQASLRTSAPDP